MGGTHFVDNPNDLEISILDYKSGEEVTIEPPQYFKDQLEEDDEIQIEVIGGRSR